MSDVLDLEGNGWHLQRDYSIETEYAVAEDARELGNVHSVAVAVKGSRTLRLLYRTDQRSAYEYAASFFRRLVGPAGRFQFSWPEFVPSPDKGPTVEAVVAGAQASRTIFVSYAWQNASGRTRASPLVEITIPDNELLKLTLPYYPPSVSQAVIYATQGAEGSEVEQAVLNYDLTWTQPDAALLLGNAPPQQQNTAQEVVTVRLLRPESFTRRLGTVYDLALELAEVL